MNFEELLETRDIRKTARIRLPYGIFCKRLIDGKYTNFVEFHDEVADHVAFSHALKTEVETMAKFSNKHQLHFAPNEGDDDVYAVAVEVGNFITIGQLLNENPSIVAKKDFIRQTVSELVDITSQLNDQGVYHLCFAPSNVFVRKNDGSVRLLFHGSFYRNLDQDVLYEGVEDFVAPEVFSGAKADARSDVFALAKFILWLYQSSGLPFELKKVIAKATAENPEGRYASITDFYKAMQNASNLRRTATAGAAALAIALCILGLFLYLLPAPDDVEFVKPVEEPIPDELMEDDELLFGIGGDADSATIAAIVSRQKHIKDSLGVDEKKMREFNAKAEQIFRKQFAKEADAIISKVYNNENMNMSEKEFMMKSKSMTEELAKKQEELAKSANMSVDRANGIASQIIEQITNKKMQALDKDKQ